MGAMSSEILHFLKVKLPLQNDQRWLPLLSWFSKFSGEDPRIPFRKYVAILQSNTTQHKTSSVGPASLICDLLAKDLLYPLSVKYRVGKNQDPVKNVRKFNVNLHFVCY